MRLRKILTKILLELLLVNFEENVRRYRVGVFCRINCWELRRKFVRFSGKFRRILKAL